MRQSSGNRDQTIADKIADAAEDSEKVVAIVGGSHLSGIKEGLPLDIDTTVHRPVYGFCTFRHLKEAVPPLFKTGLVFVLLLSAHCLALFPRTPVLPRPGSDTVIRSFCSHS
jgi:pheromone shutdown protein TraB